MTLKTFNVEETTYVRFSRICKENGISMSRQIENFMRTFVREEPAARKEYLQKLEKIRRGRFTKVSNLSQRYGL